MRLFQRSLGSENPLPLLPRVTVAPITRAKRARRVNGTTVAANRARESNNGFHNAIGILRGILAFALANSRKK